jgi:dTDP-4-amino-4,6-dideoxygalactose transaminase
MKKVPMFDVNRKIGRYRTEIEAAFNQVISSGNLVLGNEVSSFEFEFSRFLNIDHCIGVGNGTDAIELALKSFELPRNSFVLTAANAGGYASTSIKNSGLTPKFIEVDPATGLVNLNLCKEVSLDGVSAVVLTHLYGNVIPELEEIISYFRSHDVRTIEDCAQAHGAKFNEDYVGTFADISTFSFYPTKNLGALGDGGAVVTNDSSLASKLKKLRVYGWNGKYDVQEKQGRNSRLDEMQAAFLRIFLRDLNLDNHRRYDIAQMYRVGINPGVGTCLITASNSFSSNHLFPIKCKTREPLIQHLSNHGISCAVHYPIADFDQPGFGASESQLVNTMELGNSVLSLPIFPEMTDEEVNLVISALNSFSI